MTDNGWISVKDRLPEDYVNVLVYESRRGKIYAYYHYESPYDWGVWQSGRITHWQPLPEPPEEDSDA